MCANFRFDSTNSGDVTMLTTIPAAHTGKNHLRCRLDGK